MIATAVGFPPAPKPDARKVKALIDRLNSDDIDVLRVEIDHLDAEILRLVKRRTEVSKQIGRARMAAGGPRIVYSREMAVLARFRDLGSEGRDLALLLLRPGRGRLGGA